MFRKNRYNFQISIMTSFLLKGHVERERCGLSDSKHFDERQRSDPTSVQKFPTATSKRLHHKKRFQVFAKFNNFGH